MAESIAISRSASRGEIYNQILPQIDALIAGETDLTANLANISAALKEAFDFLWVGFYLEKDSQLVLGPFQGPVACTRIDLREGVCGHAFTTGEAVIVPDVDKFPGHIACSSASRSEIVLPIFRPDGSVFGVLDVDSERLGHFGDIDRDGLGAVVTLIERFIRSHTNSEQHE